MGRFRKQVKKIVCTSSVLATALFALSSGGIAHAATQGTLGATSTGTVNIQASVPARVRITGLADVSFLNQDPGTAASDAQDVCVWSNTLNGGYQITATGNGTASAFTLANGALTVPYSVEWDDTAGQTTGTALTTATALTGQTSAATQQICATGPANSASLIIGIGTADLGTMQAATVYSGILTLVVAPA